MYSAKEMHYLMNGEAPRPGRHSDVWMKVLLASSTLLPKTDASHAAPLSPPHAELSPCPLAMELAFREVDRDPTSHDLKELYALCNAFQLHPSPSHVQHILTHPTFLQEADDLFFRLTRPTLETIARIYPKFQFLTGNISLDDWRQLTPAHKKLLNRILFIWHEHNPFLLEDITIPVKEFCDIWEEIVYRPWQHRHSFIQNLQTRKSKKINQRLAVFRLEAETPDWIHQTLHQINDLHLLSDAEIPEDFSFPEPPALDEDLTRSQILLSWIHTASWKQQWKDQLLEKFQDQDQTASPKLSLALLHAAYFHREKDFLQHHVLTILLSLPLEVLPNCKKLIQSIAAFLGSQIFFRKINEVLESDTPVLQQIDVLHRIWWTTDLFLSRELSLKMCPLIEGLLDLPEEEFHSNPFIAQFLKDLALRIHPSSKKQLSGADPFDIFVPDVVEQFHSTLKQRTILYQKLSAWQKRKTP